ncbi:L-2-hydroxyglutarate oxidase [Paludibacterium sp. THUN1379]|uniref:L-2-hydroxyglutarate oxidase n=1 Tax=Paludibacterium sp. THUN1379 TaxID=3112107 RepID=UPI00308526C4|nr:L-2-hydroxyglutarate oxidase [Paludibacterium sp. THUN1379]
MPVLVTCKNIMAQTCDYLIVGAGIVGLTVARELKRRNPAAKIIVLEKDVEVGKHASGRNSGVLHSGVYYGSTTLKAKVCSSGATKMRLFAEEHNIPCRRSGKVIIATSERDLPTVERLLKNAKENGIVAERLDEDGIRRLEPHATAYQTGIYCPDTAVIDSKAVVCKLRTLLEQEGVEIVFESPLVSALPSEKIAQTPKETFSYGYLFNCAGAGADIVAKKFGLAKDYTLVPFKGIYYKLRPERRDLVLGNIYPVPDVDLPFLGVHLTRGISGDVYVGPTAIPALGRENYGILKGLELFESMKIGVELFGMYCANKQNFRLLVHTEAKKYLKSSFLASAQKLMKELTASDLIPCDKVGIRPQLINVKTKTLEMDYIIERTDSTLHVLNSISPAFTSSMAFAEWLVDRVEEAR